LLNSKEPTRKPKLAKEMQLYNRLTCHRQALLPTAIITQVNCMV